MDSISLAVLKIATDREQKGEIDIIGDQLRLRLHEDKYIRDRRYHLRTYPNCFMAREVVDWLIDRKEAPDRPTAVQLMQKTMEHDIIHHSCDEYKDFKDSRRFYRFRKDDGTSQLDLEMMVFSRGQRLSEKVMNSDNSLLQAREEDGVKYERAFVATEMVTWLIQEQESKNRGDAEQLCRRLLEHAIIQHVSSKHHFVDGPLLYQFRLNFRRRRKIMELLIKRPQTVVESQDSPFCVRKQSHDKSASFNSVSPNSEVKVASAVRRSSMTSSSSSGYFSNSPALGNSPPVVLCNPRSVLKRPVTLDELLAPGAPYIRKTLTVVSDAVGWGFVVRGEKPCHIQAVDPTGPAASAGVKIRHFVVSVNGLNVLHCHFRAVSNLVLTGPRTIVMEVMEEVEP
ncbi:DEP domain-containing mTOR-interacting protein [Rana temporaria]|uniref:DEP domain-containing mTOR-interacting protein n=1 Tax=Rana temporaria TaxID=8407 RepID=UPI001AADC46D|nr:DEP domain-containing mTOR-interacting protein [Rana temporaria]XP_040210850.1 DEP domain-containing mTOR-interacting protein [Rana temporaria]